MRNLTFLALLSLTACSEPLPVFKPVAVDMPIATPCKVATPAAPASLLRQLPDNATIFDKSKSALAELDQRRAYEAQLTAALAACQ
jgi:hypothetical protein